MKVKHLGDKKRIPIYLPVGAKTRSTIKQVVWADPVAELEDRDALELVARFPQWFEIVDGVEIHEDAPPVKKAGRPRKEAVSE